MSRLRKRLIVVCSLIVVYGLLFIYGNGIYAKENKGVITAVPISKDFVKYVELMDEKDDFSYMPRVFVNTTEQMVKPENEINKMMMLGANYETGYSLKDDIPENLTIRNQGNTNTCWTFSALSALETNLAMRNMLDNKTTVTYDFSERHMEYATIRELKGTTNKYGFNRKTDSGGKASMKHSSAYFTNGMGAVSESSMPFVEDTSDMYTYSDVSSKEVVTQVYDIVKFPTTTPSELTTDYIEEMKNHITRYGSLDVSICAPDGIDASGIGTATSPIDGSVHYIYNNNTGAHYSDEASVNDYHLSINHAVSIVGWDDNYAVENFLANNRPSKNGAWIVRNSWGSEVYDDTGNAVKVGDNGFIYVSYEDGNIYQDISGIVKADDKINYDNLYQHDELGETYQVYISDIGNTVYLASKFDKNNKGENEYLTEVSLFVAGNVKCIVYVNPSDSLLTSSKLQKVKLKNGDYESLTPGYHTLEFENSIVLDGSEFAVVVSVESLDFTDTAVASFEAKWINTDFPWSVVDLSSGKCFYSDSLNGEWNDLSELSIDDPTGYTSVKGADNCIKAFTTNTRKDHTVKEIRVKNQPVKTEYYVGDNFDPAGMIIEVVFYDGETETISDYTILNGTNLKEDMTTVTISYENNTVEIDINVYDNDVKYIEIQTPPNKLEYREGQSFDREGMVVVAYWINGTSTEVSDYQITDGDYLEFGQTEITIYYNDKSVTQEINVLKNEVVSVEINTQPSRKDYIVGQDFDPLGMTLKVKYEDGSERIVDSDDFEVLDGEKLTIDSKQVTIKFDKYEVTQTITVSEKSISTVVIENKPTKLTYTQGDKELDLTGGSLYVTYNDGSSESISFNDTNVSVTGFDSSRVGRNTITVEYMNKRNEFNVTITKAEDVTPSPTVDPTDRPSPEPTTSDDPIPSVEPSKTPTTPEPTTSDEPTPEPSTTNEPTPDPSITNDPTPDPEPSDEPTPEPTQSPETTDEPSPKPTSSNEPSPSTGTDDKDNGDDDKNDGEDDDEQKLPENSDFYSSKYRNTYLEIQINSKNKDENYLVFDVVISNIKKATVNDSMTYYYYLSSDKNVSVPSDDDWVKLEGTNIENGILRFRVDTRAIKNFGDVANAEKLYLVVKEVAVRDGNSKVVITSGMDVSVSEQKVTYVDGVKLEENNAPEVDNTTADTKYPFTGKVVIVLAIVILAGFGIHGFVKFRNIDR